MNILIVVDMQKDFIDGALGTKEAVAITDNVAKVIENFDGQVIFTRDTHTEDYLNTQEGRKLPVVHCVKGTYGWELDEKLKPYVSEKTPVFDKPSFGSMELAKYVSELENVETITLVGLCTDICVISNAMILKAAMPEAELRVIENACAGVTPESHANALAAMKMCQIEII